MSNHSCCDPRPIRWSDGTFYIIRQSKSGLSPSSPPCEQSSRLSKGHPQCRQPTHFFRLVCCSIRYSASSRSHLAFSSARSTDCPPPPRGPTRKHQTVQLASCLALLDFLKIQRKLLGFPLNSFDRFRPASVRCYVKCIRSTSSLLLFDSHQHPRLLLRPLLLSLLKNGGYTSCPVDTSHLQARALEEGRAGSVVWVCSRYTTSKSVW